MARRDGAAPAVSLSRRLRRSVAAKAAAPHEELLTYWLHRELARTQPARSLDRIHASDVTNQREQWCPKRHALLQLTGKRARPERISTADAVVFSQGNGLATLMVNAMARAGMAWGDWVCTACGRVETFAKRPKHCNCAAVRHSFRYQEVRVVSQESGISSGLDLLIEMPGSTKLWVVEIKTYDKEKFKKLHAPLAEHSERTKLYLRGVEESNHPQADMIRTDEAIIIYISKGGWGMKDTRPREWGLADLWSPFKEFRVSRDDEAIQEYVDAATPLWHWQSGRAGLPSGVCPNSLCRRAKGCEVFDACFGGDYPAGSHRKDPA